MKKILKVKDIELSILKTNPPILKIKCEGEVNSSGWNNAQLIPYVYITPPADGIYEFDFVADEPNGPSSDVIGDIKAIYEWQSFPTDLNGVRVFASQNNEEELLMQKDSGVLFKGIEVEHQNFEAALAEKAPKSRLVFVIKYAPKGAFFALRSLKEGDKQLLAQSIKGSNGEISFKMGVYADKAKLKIESFTQAFTEVKKAKSAIVQDNPNDAKELATIKQPIKAGKTWKETKEYTVK